MKKTSKAKPRPAIRAEYDFSDGVRGKYAARYRSGTNLVALDADVAKAFDSPEAVNRALRALLTALPPRRTRRSKRTG